MQGFRTLERDAQVLAKEAGKRLRWEFRLTNRFTHGDRRWNGLAIESDRDILSVCGKLRR